ncbi:phytanoyl-CoA dioxygenase family protein [Parahaliea mediterranea]|uniref:Phytanoyl-CoA dioxygenase family protein n=1 Tax=Parahaliea mediterranea TaxID=651086 RepID=A0A939IIF1_9GAMM|nr:phytanoyl-CoA dioxygenase family protein [Parahaliea mediterranea]MBN7796544.1 phytanoyl-CoA dioxygenase family protein [Parahaliea mediterranea]
MTTNSIPRLRADCDPTQLTQTLLTHGAVIVEGFLDSATLGAFNREMDGPLGQQSPERRFLSPIYDQFFGTKTRHLTGLSGRSEIFREQIMSHPLYLELCEQILRPNCADYQLNYGHIFEIAPGATAQALHRDGSCWSYLPSDFEVEVASIVALSDFSETNGATLVIPGSHRWSPERPLDYADAVPAIMPAGSALLYLGATAHAAGSNTTSDELRRGMHVSYCLGWLRTEENNYLAAPLDEVRTYSRQAQKLLGYSAHDAAPEGGCLGVFSMLDPVDLIADGRL